MKIYEFLAHLGGLLEEYYPHLRHNLREEVEIDDFLKEKIISILNINKGIKKYRKP